MRKDSNMQVLMKGILKENPVLVLILGTCPTLATTGTVDGAVGMGLAALAVLLCSNIFISLLRNIIPAATELQEMDAIKNSIVAQAIFDTINGKSAFQPKIPEMDPVWGPVGTFGGNIKEGMITKDNIVESVDALDAQLNGDL